MQTPHRELQVDLMIIADFHLLVLNSLRCCCHFWLLGVPGAPLGCLRPLMGLAPGRHALGKPGGTLLFVLSSALAEHGLRRHPTSYRNGWGRKVRKAGSQEPAESKTHSPVVLKCAASPACSSGHGKCHRRAIFCKAGATSLGRNDEISVMITLVF